MRTLLLFAGILFPVVATIVIVEAPWIDGTPETLSICSLIGMVMIFFSGRHEAAAAFYLEVALSSMAGTMLPMVLPPWLGTASAYFLASMYLALYMLGRRSKK